MSVRNQLLMCVGLLASLWLSGGQILFGLWGQLSWWYLGFLGFPYLVLQIWAIRKIASVERRNRRVGRAPFVALILSWLCALGFGLTVPNIVNEQWVSILGKYWGELWNEMAIALCNPFGIIAFATVIAAIAFAAAAGRDPRPEEEYTGQMVPHPFQN